MPYNRMNSYEKRSVMQIQNPDITNALQRKIELQENGIILSTDGAAGLEYAFYLEHSNGLEKKYYSDNLTHFFQIHPNLGRYTATFFYKKNTTIISHKIAFVIGEQQKIFLIKKANLATSKHFKIDNYDIGSNTTFVVFNGSGSTIYSPPFGLSFLLCRGYNVIVCLQNNNQYQGLSFEDFGKYVGPAVKGKATYLYGSSLGGYCAVYYAGAVKGHVIASAPRNSAHPALITYSPKKNNYNADDFQHKDIFENELSPASVNIFIDPHVPEDVFFLNNYVRTAYPKVNLLEYQHAGHEVLMHVNRIGHLKNIIGAIVDNRPFEIDQNTDSEFTEIGKAHFFLKKQDIRRATIYYQRALNRKSPNKAVAAKIRAIKRELGLLKNQKSV
ncbi:hypothetical protein [Advenella mimigardefordensis]|uniref:Uncharacterized protein n=1 Tax=Advenella mimigardefordensis (strain DSM 17166 / LMG 22922 / DPN7) TaxID=1247726 RepID=W0PJV1_ADVMD|nr:hypothetical protein [Advenella mimigardefordensis]AHG65830.1 hypothetical protein MIM_c37730 [Advenella mimigardefordensis DPN7]